MQEFDLGWLNDYELNDLKDFYLGLCFSSDNISCEEEQIFFIMNNIDIFNIRSYNDVLEAIITTQDDVRHNSTGFYKVKTILMSEKTFEKLKNQQKIDENINSILVRGAKVSPSKYINDTKIFFIADPKKKCSGKITNKITILENKNDAPN